MAQIRWDKELYRGGNIRKTFLSWQIPPSIRLAYDIRDKDYLEATIHIGRRNVQGCFRVSSDGELHVGAQFAEEIEAYARRQSADKISFSMESFLITAEDSEQESNISETTRLALIAARRGQGIFRRRLMRLYDRQCAVTGNDVEDLLRASHIKPWCVSNTAERLSAHNGLLLVATLDAAFDSMLISFSDAGTILCRPELGLSPANILGIKKDSKLIRRLSQEQIENLKYHRKAAMEKWGRKDWNTL